MSEIGLFPLGVVLLPTERLPLHIFEERYKELIGECMQADQEFGLVFADDDGMRAAGTRAAVVEVLQRFPDGRLNIVVEGRERFRIVQMTSGRSFDTAIVEDLSDETEKDVPVPDDLAGCLQAYRRLAEAAGAQPDDFDPGAGSVAFQIAAVIDFTPELKQELLELQSEGERLARLTGFLDRAVDAVLLQQTARERAAGNGHVSPDD
ncbi:MAG TPA: LON peptidase substrate-binding domain-containing protein [Actinomycetota bacterium]